RGEVDDLAIVVLGHFTRHRLHAEKQPFRIDRVNPIPVSLGDFKEVELLVDAGIVHQDVDATKRFDSFLDHGVDMTETAHICLHEESTSIARAARRVRAGTAGLPAPPRAPARTTPIWWMPAGAEPRRVSRAATHSDPT